MNVHYWFLFFSLFSRLIAIVDFWTEILHGEGLVSSTLYSTVLPLDSLKNSKYLGVPVPELSLFIGANLPEEIFSEAIQKKYDKGYKKYSNRVLNCNDCLPLIDR